jgi:cyclic pyranopterin phosphate synthase
MITDQYNRIHNYLRISLTDICNLRCFYCMPEEDYAFSPASHLMKLSEIETLARTFVEAGVDKIRLTGGEPLVRPDAAEVILALAKLPVELTLTTNGTRLHKFIDVLKQARIKSVNISLDTLDPEKFNGITRRKQFDMVWRNIQLLLENNFLVKINMVVMKGVNDHEINDFIEWTRDTPVDVRFIEFMPFTGNRWTNNQVITMHEILENISERYDLVPLEKKPHDTSKKFRVPGHAVSFAVISTMSSHFCGDCILMSHNYDYDRDVLKKLLNSPAPYIGILGPLKRFNKMLDEFERENIQLSSYDFDRIHAPIGLDIAAESPQEIAVSIIGEIQAKLHKRKGMFLKERGGPIHERDEKNSEVLKMAYV